LSTPNFLSPFFSFHPTLAAFLLLLLVAFLQLFFPTFFLFLLRSFRFFLTFIAFSVPLYYININSLPSPSICMLWLIPPRTSVAARQRWRQWSINSEIFTYSIRVSKESDSKGLLQFNVEYESWYGTRIHRTHKMCLYQR
jgi:hypothetical protein